MEVKHLVLSRVSDHLRLLHCCIVTQWRGDGRGKPTLGRIRKGMGFFGD